MGPDADGGHGDAVVLASTLTVAGFALMSEMEGFGHVRVRGV